MQKTVRDVFQDYTNKNNILEGEIEAINLFKKSNKLEVDIKVRNQLTLDELVDFESYLSNRFQIKTIEIRIKYDGIELKNTIHEDWENIRKYISKRFPVTKAILKDSSVEVIENKAVINLKTKNSDFLHSYEIDKVLNVIFMNLYGKSYKIEYKEDVTEEELQKQQSFLEEIQNNVCKNLVHNMEVIANEKKAVAAKPVEGEGKADEEPKEETPLIIGRSANIKEQVVKIKDLTVDYGRTALQGKVIRTDSRELKNGKTLVMFDVYDGTSTITCKSRKGFKCFSKNKTKNEGKITRKCAI